MSEDDRPTKRTFPAATPARPPPRPAMRSSPDRVSTTNEQLRTLQDSPPAPRFGDEERKTSPGGRVGRLEDDYKSFRKEYEDLVAGLKTREAAKHRHEQAVGMVVALIAREVGLEEQLPAELKTSIPPPPDERDTGPITPPPPPPLLPALAEDQAKQAKRAKWAVVISLFVAALEFGSQILRFFQHP